MTAADGDVKTSGIPSLGSHLAAAPSTENGTGAAAALDSIDAELNGLSGLDTADHVQVYARIHQQLTSALAITVQAGPSSDPQLDARQPGH